MDVAVVYPYDPTSPGEGGGVRYTTNLVRCLRKHDINVKLLGVGLHTTRGHGDSELDFVPVINGTDCWWMYFLGLIVRAPLAGIGRGSIVHVHRTYFILPFIILKNRSHLVCTLHMKPLEFVKVQYPLALPVIDGVHRLIEGLCLRAIELPIAVNSDVRDAYCRRYPWLKNKIVVIPGTSVDLEKFRPMNKAEAKRRNGFEEHERIIMYVGRVERIKNLELLLKAFGIVDKRIDGARLSIVGRGGDLNRIVDIAETLGTRNRVRFHGEIPPDNIPELMNCADVVVLSSVSESSPTVPREALACGVPVVSTDVGDIKDVVTNRFAGRVVAPNEVDFANAVIDVVDVSISHNDDVIRTCREISSRFDLDKVCTEVLKCYWALTERKS